MQQQIWLLSSNRQAQGDKQILRQQDLECRSCKFNLWVDVSNFSLHALFPDLYMEPAKLHSSFLFSYSASVGMSAIIIAIDGLHECQLFSDRMLKMPFQKVAWTAIFMPKSTDWVLHLDRLALVINVGTSIRVIRLKLTCCNAFTKMIPSVAVAHPGDNVSKKTQRF